MTSKNFLFKNSVKMDWIGQMTILTILCNRFHTCAANEPN